MEKKKRNLTEAENLLLRKGLEAAKDKRYLGLVGGVEVGGCYIFSTVSIKACVTTMPLTGAKRNAAAAALTRAMGMAKRRRTDKSIVRRVRTLENKVSSDEKHYKEYDNFHAAFHALTQTNPFAWIPTVNQGASSSARNGQKLYWQKGVARIQLHWQPDGGTYFVDGPHRAVRILVVLKLQKGVVDPGSSSDLVVAQATLKQLLWPASDFVSIFPKVMDMTRLPGDPGHVGEDRHDYLIIKDITIEPGRTGLQGVHVDPGATGVWPDAIVMHKTITWSIKNHEAIFEDATNGKRPRAGQLQVIAFTEGARAVNLRVQARQFWTETKV